MTWFLAVGAAMVAAALAWVLIPLLARPTRATPAPEAANLAVLRDQLAELDSDLARGILSPERYEQSKLELERRVLEEARPASTPAESPVASPRTAVILAAGLPIGAIALYLAVGAPTALLREPGVKPGPQHEITREQLEGLVTKLAQQVDRSPDDAKGWMLLARSNYVLGR